MQRLMDKFKYNPKTGVLYRKKANGDFVPTSNTPSTSTGYKRVWFEGKRIEQHRVIWFLMKGYPPNQVDHIDGNPLNNKWENLREVDHRGNARNMSLSKNNTSGHYGVSFCNSRQKWRATFRNKHIGYFSCITAAIVARKKFERENGFHPNHGRPKQCAD